MAYFRKGRSQFIKWEDIVAIFYQPGDPSRHGLAKEGGASYSLANTHPIYLRIDVAYKLREAYAEKVGRYPPNKSIVRR